MVESHAFRFRKSEGRLNSAMRSSGQSRGCQLVRSAQRFEVKHVQYRCDGRHTLNLARPLCHQHRGWMLSDISTLPQHGAFKFSHSDPFPSINVLEACSPGAPSLSSSQVSRFSHRFARFAMMRHSFHAIGGRMKPCPWRPPAASLGLFPNTTRAALRSINIDEGMPTVDICSLWIHCLRACLLTRRLMSAGCRTCRPAIN